MKNRLFLLVLFLALFVGVSAWAQNNSGPFPCPQYSPPAPGWCSDGTIVQRPHDANGCAVPPNCVYKCSTNNDCGPELVCPNGKLYREKTCVNGSCQMMAFTGGTPCFDEGFDEGGVVSSCPTGCICSVNTVTCPSCIPGSDCFKEEPYRPFPIKCDNAGNCYMPMTGGSNGVANTSDNDGESIVDMTKYYSENGPYNPFPVKCDNQGNCYAPMSGSDDKRAEIKIMPETASEKAIERLGNLGFTIELKEVGKGDDAKMVYELNGKKQGRFLGIFKIMEKIQVQVDVETGDMKVKKPWWSFLVKE